MNKFISILLVIGTVSLLAGAQPPQDPARIAKMIEEATPKELPQSPAIKRLTTDAFDEGLKGKVKKVSESKATTSSAGKIQMSYEDFYDKNGNQMKHIYYDYRGNPGMIDVYGFIDGKRVKNVGYIRHEYDPPPPMARKQTIGDAPKPVADTRFLISYIYKYDEKGRLKEKKGYGNSGELYWRTTYVYEGNKIVLMSYDKTDKITSNTIELYDDKSNLIEVTYVSTSEDLSDSFYKHAYEKFDEKGNWTKRVVTGKTGQWAGGQKDFLATEYRTITYH